MHRATSDNGRHYPKSRGTHSRSSPGGAAGDSGDGSGIHALAARVRCPLRRPRSRWGVIRTAAPWVDRTWFCLLPARTRLVRGRGGARRAAGRDRGRRGGRCRDGIGPAARRSGSPAREGAQRRAFCSAGARRQGRRRAEARTETEPP